MWVPPILGLHLRSCKAPTCSLPVLDGPPFCVVPELNWPRLFASLTCRHASYPPHVRSAACAQLPPLLQVHDLWAAILAVPGPLWAPAAVCARAAPSHFPVRPPPPLVCSPCCAKTNAIEGISSSCHRRLQEGVQEVELPACQDALMTVLMACSYSVWVAAAEGLLSLLLCKSCSITWVGA